MKKIVTTLLFLAVLAVGISSAQGRVYDKNLAKWSLGIKGGIDYYRVEPYAVAANNFWWKGSWSNYALQASWAFPLVFVEYTVNPWFGVGLELGWLNYNRSLATDQIVKGTGKTAHAGLYLGNTADALLYGSINLTNLIAPYRQGGWRILSVYANGGLGGAWYRYKTPDTNNKFSNHLAFMGMASLTTAFNVSKVWELFVEGQYRSYTKEDMGGLSAAGHSIDAITFLVGVRWKLGGGKKPSPYHERNDLLKDNGGESLADAIAAKKIAENANDKADGLGDRVKALENDKPKPTNSELDNAIKDLQKQIDDLKKGQTPTGTASFKDIRFKTDSNELTSESTKILDEVFNVLNNDSWTTLEIFGYTDNVGSAAYNQKLSERRANAVKDYLAKKGLDAAKMKAIGKGIRGNENTVEGRADNRRVDFRVSK